MASTLYIVVCAIIIVLLFLAAFIQNCVDPNRLLATPTIPIENGVLSSLGTTKIHASPDEVFAAIMDFKEYSKWSSTFSEYRWRDMNAEGVPTVGSKGNFKLYVEGFGSRILPVQLTRLDLQRKKLAERTTSYPRWLLGSERVQEVVPVEGQQGVCEYRTYQTLEGVAAYFLLLTATDELADAQQRCANDLRAFIETRKKRA